MNFKHHWLWIWYWIWGITIQEFDKKQIVFNAQEQVLMSQEIEKLLNEQNICEIEIEDVKYLSSFFLRPKQDRPYRLILNLKNLHDYVEKLYFKMETLKTALTMVTSHCFLACINLKNILQHSL